MNTKVYRVTELTRAIRALLQTEIGSIWLEGELSNFRRPSSGHCYFTLKDETAQIAAVLFRGNQRQLGFTPRDGLTVRVFGDLSVYERSGQYQIIVRRMQEAGEGALQAAFETLKKTLQEEGLFDAARKKPLPLLVQRVGIVTSPTGAAIRDILAVIERRFPNLHLTIAPARVQGDGAAADIAAAIRMLNERGGFDALIVGRGGGSLEDLWCFNEEIVARAIAESRIPVLSAVGHEIDFTIADFVADLRAPTPSAAAELVVGTKEDLTNRIRQAGTRLAGAARHRLLEFRSRLNAAGEHHAFREPAHVVRQFRMRTNELRIRMRHEARNSIRAASQRLDELALNVPRLAKQRHTELARRVESLSSQLRALSPLAILERGYSITYGTDGSPITDAEEIPLGTLLSTRLAHGILRSEVIEKHDGKATG